MPSISVIIPAYNSEKTIQETIESVLNQTFFNFEIIIINDGSTDSTLDIISQLVEPRLKVFSYPNQGTSASRNCGVIHACGEFIAFLDHDDLWTADKLESQFQALQENPQAAVAYSWVDLIDRCSQFIRPLPRTQVIGNTYAKLLFTNYLHTASNPLIRKDAFLKVGGFDESLSGPEDWDLFLRLAEQYEFVTVPRVQVLFRMTGGSISADVCQIESGCLEVIEKAFARSPQSLQHLKKPSLANLYLYFTFRALEVPSGLKSSLIATRCFWYAIKHNPSLLHRRQIALTALFKIVVVFFLPAQKSNALLRKMKLLKKWTIKKFGITYSSI